MKLLSILLFVAAGLLLLAALGPEMAEEQSFSPVLIKKQFLFLQLACALLVSSTFVGCFHKLIEEIKSGDTDE